MTRRFDGEDDFHQAIRDAFEFIEAVIGLTVESKTKTSPDGTESAGEMYIVPDGASGAWAGQDQNLAINKASWEFIDPTAPTNPLYYRAWVKDEDFLYVFNGSIWVKLEGGGLTTTAGTQTGYRETVTLSPDTPATINHGLGKQYPAVTILNGDDDVVILQRVTASDSNNLEVVAGTNVTVTVIAQANNSGLYTEQVTFTANSPATITHGLGFEYVLVSAYDENDELFYFHNTQTVDDTELTMTVARSFTGNVACYRSPDIFSQNVTLSANTEKSITHNLNVPQLAPVFYRSSEYTLLENINVNDTNIVKLLSGNDLNGTVAIHA